MDLRPQRFSILPPVIKNLLLINVILFVAKSLLVRFNVNLDEILSLHFVGAESFKPFQIITHLFMHADFWHLFMNMFALWMFGYMVENFWGAQRFFIYYFVTGICASALYYLVFYLENLEMLTAFNNFLENPEIKEYELKVISYMQPYVKVPISLGDLSWADVSAFKNMLLNGVSVMGASGAVFAVLFAFAWMWPNAPVYVYFVIPVKVKYVVIIYILFEFFAIMKNNPTDHVAHFAHLGGIVFGFILIRLWKVRHLN